MAKKKKNIKENDQRREISNEEQKIVQEAEIQQRVAECTTKIRMLLQEYQCDLDVSMVLRAGQVIPRVSVVPIEVAQAEQQMEQ